MSDGKMIVTAEDLLAKMRAGTKETYEIRMREFHVQVRVLSIDEMNTIRREAYVNALGAKGDEIDKNVITQKLILQKASTLVPTIGPVLSARLLGMMSTDEINFLYDEYMNVTERVNPALESISPEAFQELVDSLKKNLISVNELSIRQQKVICSSYVDLISRKDS